MFGSSKYLGNGRNPNYSEVNHSLLKIEERPEYKGFCYIEKKTEYRCQMEKNECSYFSALGVASRTGHRKGGTLWHYVFMKITRISGTSLVRYWNEIVLIVTNHRSGNFEFY